MPRSQKSEIQTGARKVKATATAARAAPPAKSSPDEELLKLGQRIRDLRSRAGMTLQELSKVTKTSIGTLSQLERGLASPSVRTIYTVASAFGVMPAWLIDPSQIGANGAENQYIVTAGQRPRLFDIDGIRKEVASPAASERLRAFFMVIQPGSSSGAQSYTHKGEEIGFLLSGTLKLQINGDLYSLNEGDCFSFSSTVPHRFENTGTEPASVFWVNANI